MKIRRTALIADRLWGLDRGRGKVHGIGGSNGHLRYAPHKQEVNKHCYRDAHEGAACKKENH